MTLATRFDPRANSLNAIRLLLAALVIVSHSWPLSGREPEPTLGGANLGVWAVFGFFAISGFLVTRSRMNGQSATNYYRARALRIFPAFLVCLVVVAFAFAPASILLDPAGSWSPSSAGSFVLRNLALYPPNLFQGGIAGTLTAVPFLELWNGPLWTLFWEACCYIAVGVAVTLIPRSRLNAFLLIGFAGLTLVSLAGALGVVELPAMMTRIIPLFIAFVCGALLFRFSERVRVNVITVSAAAVILALLIMANLVPQLALLPFAYLLLAVGASPRLRRVGSRFDISYGIYIYGWPVQQTLALAFGESLPLPIFILLALLGTVPLAFLSCALIERPALRLKSKPASQKQLGVAAA